MSVDGFAPQDAAYLFRTLERFNTRKRLSDVMGWYDDRKLAFLLPNTREDQARVVLERLKGYLMHPTQCNLPAAWENGCFSILEYPRDLIEFLSSGEDETHPPDDPSGGNGRPNRESLSSLLESGFLDRTSLCRRRRRKRASSTYDVLKRILDIVLASIGLVVVSPVMAAIALLIKMTSEGPVLFRQKRVGKDGKEFVFYKFRTMIHNCDQRLHREYVCRLIQNRAEKHVVQDRAYYKLVDDPRVTRVGKILRKTSLDELPQLFNVLKGEMSLVGPRPPLAYEVERYQTWQLRRILEAKPGITGLWQVSGRASTTFDEQVRLDLKYVAKQSLWTDIIILLRTFKAVFEMTGAA